MTNFNYNTDNESKIYTHAIIGDTWTAPTGAREAVQTYQVTDIYGDQTGIKYGVVTGTLIKKDGTLGKRKMELVQCFQSSIGMVGIEYRFTNR